MRWDEPRLVDLTEYRPRRRRRWPSVGWLVGQGLLLIAALAMTWGILTVAWALWG